MSESKYNASYEKISHNKGNCYRFMKLLSQLRFVHCAMVIPFISNWLALSIAFFPLPKLKVKHFKKGVV